MEEVCPDEAALPASSFSALSFYRTGVLFQQARKHAIAIRSFRKALQEENESSNAHVNRALFNIAHSLLALHDYEGAESVYRQLISTPDDSCDFKELCYLNLCAILLKMEGREGEALEMCEEALSHHTKMPDLMIQLNTILRLMGRQEEAITRSWQAIKERCVDLDLEPPIMAWLSLYGRQGDNGDEEGGGEKGSRHPREVYFVMVKWGKKYGAEYVNKLAKAIKRHLPKEAELSKASIYCVRILCLTDDATGLDTSLVKPIAIPSNLILSGWWVKAYLFSAFPVTPGSQLIYLDLDTVIIGSLQKLLLFAAPPHHHISSATNRKSKGVLTTLSTTDMLNEKNRKGGYNTSLMMWTAGSRLLLAIYNELVRLWPAVGKVIQKFDHWIEMCVPSSHVDLIQEHHPGLVVEYQAYVQQQHQQQQQQQEQQDGSLGHSHSCPPKGPSIVCFPLKPKPHECQEEWIKAHW